MRLSKRHRWLRRLALGLAVAAVAAPSAQAITPIGAPEFPTWTVDWAEPATAGCPPSSRPGPWAGPSGRRLPPSSRPGPVGWAQPKAPESPAATPTGFDYGDAGIVAAIAFGAALLAAAGFLGLRRSRRSARPRLSVQEQPRCTIRAPSGADGFSTSPPRTSFACRRSTARRARRFDPPSGRRRPSPQTSAGPRIRNSIRLPPGRDANSCYSSETDLKRTGSTIGFDREAEPMRKGDERDAQESSPTRRSRPGKE